MSEQAMKLVLKCALCDYVPPENSTMEEFDLHSRLEHDGADLAMELIPQCVLHGVFMEFVETKPTGGGFKDWFRCPEDGATGFIRRAK